MPNKSKGKSSKQYYDENPASKKKKQDYQREYNKKPEQRKKRSELVQLNRESQKKGKSKVGDGKDIAHSASGTRLQDASKNRGSKSAMPGDKRARGGKKK